MKLIIKTHKLKYKAGIIQHIHQRVGFAFSRSRQLIQSLTISMRDINGPRGGIDKECVVMVNSELLPDIVIREKQSRLQLAIDRAITRASHNLMQKIKRRRQIRLRHREPHRLPKPELAG